MRRGSFRQTTKRSLDDSIHAGRLLAGRHDGALLAYERLLRQVRTQTGLLHPSDRYGDNRNLLNAGLLALSLHHADWLRPVETWFRVSNHSRERGTEDFGPQSPVESCQAASGGMAVISLAKRCQPTLKPQFTPLYLGAEDHPALVR